MTLNGAIAVILYCFTEFGTSGGQFVTVVEATPVVSATEMYNKEFSFLQYMHGDILGDH